MSLVRRHRHGNARSHSRWQMCKRSEWFSPLSTSAGMSLLKGLISSWTALARAAAERSSAAVTFMVEI